MSDTSRRSKTPAIRRSASRTAPVQPRKRRTAVVEDPFFRQIVSSMRNGVIVFRRDGTLALMNDEAYRIFAVTRRANNIGRPLVEVLQQRPAVIRVLAGAFEM